MDAIERIGLWLIAALDIVVSLIASAHVIVRKRDSRAAFAWVGVIWLVPAVGALLYVLFGINRLRRKAHALKVPRTRIAKTAREACAPEDVVRRVAEAAHLSGLARLSDRIIRQPLVAGNAVDVLDGGAQAYPAMLQAIASARRSVSMCTYIFDLDEWGERFSQALADAAGRGVDVRVLIDGVGVRYGRPPIHRTLRRAGVRTELFLPTWVPALLPYVNLRNHRKIMVIDGELGFTGGMNVRAEFATTTKPAAKDLHFRVRGPVVSHLQRCFADDWAFAAREPLEGDRWFPDIDPVGSVLARGVPDGPDEDFDDLRMLLLGALTEARRSVRIITPYFLPDASLVTALNVAALRGVKVDIVLPEHGNLIMVQWATWAQLWQNLEHGCRIYLSPPPFDHSKLMVVDSAWSLIGSANWDPRSLRLNFEFNVECYDGQLGRALSNLFDERMRQSRPLTLEEVNDRPALVRLRDGAARLLSPYL